MTTEKKPKDILDLNISRAFKYQAAACAGAFMHVTFLIIFLFNGLYILVGFNIFSVILYAVMMIRTSRPDIEEHAMCWITAMFAEVNIHAFLCTISIGVSPCFFLYSMMIIPIVIYYLFLTCPDKVFRRGTLIFSLLTIACFTLSFICLRINGELFYSGGGTLQDKTVDMMRNINITFNLLLLIGFSLLFIIEIHSLIKKLHETNEQLNFTATHDALTGLYNRHCLHDKLSEVTGGSEPFCLVMGDLDDFKKINDTYGHDCGDVVLRSVADIIMSEIGADDTACRWGGEEMLIIMHGTYSECYPKICSIKNRISDLRIEHNGMAVKVSMTFGFAAGGAGTNLCGAGIDEMISMVDKRLYKGKANGKNIIVA